jgi:hypothetical protein
MDRSRCCSVHRAFGASEGSASRGAPQGACYEWKVVVRSHGIVGAQSGEWLTRAMEQIFRCIGGGRARQSGIGLVVVFVHKMSAL